MIYSDEENVYSGKRMAVHEFAVRLLFTSALVLAMVTSSAAQTVSPKMDPKGEFLLIQEGNKPLLQLQVQSLPKANQVGIIVGDGTWAREASMTHSSPRMALAERALRGDRAAADSLMGRNPLTGEPAKAQIARPRLTGTMRSNFSHLLTALAVADLSQRFSRQISPGDQDSPSVKGFQTELQNWSQRQSTVMKEHKGWSDVTREKVGVISAKAVPVPRSRFSEENPSLAGLVALAHQAWSQGDRQARESLEKSSPKLAIGLLYIDGVPGESTRRLANQVEGDAFTSGVFLVVGQTAVKWDNGVEGPIGIIMPSAREGRSPLTRPMRR